MISTENQFQSIPYRSTVCGRPVLLTVMGRASVWPIFSPTSLSPESGSSCCLSFSLLTGPVTVLGLSCFLETVVQDEEEDMVVLETERDSREQQRCKDRKRQREPEDTNAKKAKDKEEETDLDNLDL
jgi:hypothetical protein